MRIITKAAVTAGVAGALLATAVTGSALADPPAGTVVKPGYIVGVGSDTSQAVLNQLAADYDGQSPAPGAKLYSYDAVGSDTITTKTGCDPITRPNGSGAGIGALKANARPANDTVHYCIDFARSSRGPQAGDGSGTAFVQYAQDGVVWSATTYSGHTSHAPASLSILQLRAIYSCDASILGNGGSGPVTWPQVGGVGSNAVVPVVPQSSSGTRSFFLKAIGVTTLGTCVKGQDDSVEENEGTNAIFTGAQSRDLVFPYSVAVYLAQSQNGHGTGMQGNQVLKNVTTADGSTQIKPTTGSPKQLNPALAAVGLTRFIYNVVRNQGSAHVPTYLQPIFGNGQQNTGYICTNAQAKADIVSYGFRTISNCGKVTVGF